MMFRGLFEHDGYLGAPALHLLRALPARAGTRPGRLSTELRIAKKKPVFDPKKGGIVMKPPVKPPIDPNKKGVVTKQPDPFFDPSKKGIVAPPPPSPPPPPPKHRAQINLKNRHLSGGFGDGDVQPVPFTPNGQVWVAANEVPLRAHLENVADEQQLHYPDGTPAMALYWLPRVNLASVGFDPRIPGSYWQDAPVLRGDVNSGPGRGGWAIDRDGSWAYYLVGKSLHDPVLFTIPDVQESPYVEHLGGWARRDNTPLSLTADFDWTQRTPAAAAPMWVYLNLDHQSPVVNWVVYDAEIRRADGLTVADAGEPTELPGRAWLDLNFLDAIATGAHGMPIMVKADNTIDRTVLSAFQAANPDWYTVLNFGRPGSNKGMAAIINDVGLLGAGVVHQPPPPPPVPDVPDFNLFNIVRPQQPDPNLPPPPDPNLPPPPDPNFPPPPVYQPPLNYGPPASPPPNYGPPQDYYEPPPRNPPPTGGDGGDELVYISDEELAALTGDDGSTDVEVSDEEYDEYLRQVEADGG